MIEVESGGEAEPQRTGNMTQRLRAEQRRYEVYQLALGGFSYRTIGQRYGVGVATVARDIRRVAEDRRREGLQGIEQHRQQAIDRINRLLSAIWQAASKGDEAAVRNADRLLRTLAHWLTLGEGLKVSVEHHIARIAEEADLDAAELVAEVERMVAEDQAKGR